MCGMVDYTIIILLYKKSNVIEGYLEKFAHQ
jgi:hypothetical protein